MELERQYPEFQWSLADKASPFLGAVYGWMALGLTLTAATAWYIASTPNAVGQIANQELFWGLTIAQFIIVVVLASRVRYLSAPTAGVLFIAYAILNGITVSFVLLAFTGESVASTFLVAAGMFGALATYGTVTKRSLNGIGQFLFMALVGLALASIVTLFWHNDAVQFLLSFIGVLLFSALVAYDAKRLKVMATETPEGQTSYAIVGALALYLDFTNLFLFLLRFTGSRRDY